MTSKDVVDYYTEFANKYDEVVLRDKDYIAYQKIPQWVVEAMSEASPYILDLGCGTGLSSRAFFERGWHVTGVDITPKMIEECRRLPFENLICQSLEEPLPFPDGTFDAAVMLGVMEFIQDVPRLFHVIARVLRPKALFAVTVPEKLPEDTESVLGIVTYEAAEIENLLSGAGFSVLRHEEFQGFVYKDKVVHYHGYLAKRTL